MKKDKKFLRKCAACGEYKSKDELIRITKDYSSSEIKINTENKIFGRSVYVCKSEECVTAILKKKKLEHCLKANLPENIKIMLSTVLKN